MRVKHMIKTVELKIFLIIFIKKLLFLCNSINRILGNKIYKYKYKFKNYNCAIVHNYEEIKEFGEKTANISDKYYLLNKTSKEKNITKGKVRGWCCCCNKKTDFNWQIIPKYSNDILFNESFCCPICKMNNRQRALIHIFKMFEKSNPQNKKIYCYENDTVFMQYLKSKFCINNEIIGSEFFGFDKKPGEIINGVRHEDCMNLSFKDNELDYILSNDVFEHVPDIHKSLKEALRCLKVGGKLIFHIPLDLNREQTLKRAEIINGEILYKAPKEYHGGFSYTDPEGCLVFYNFGRDIFDIIKDAGFSNTYGITVQDEKFVNISSMPLVFFVCEK